MTEHQMGDWERYGGSIWSAPIHYVRTCTVCDTTEDRYEVTFAWIKPLVLTTLLMLVLAAAVCCAMAAKLRGAGRNKEGVVHVLRKALTLKNEDVMAVIRDLRNAISDQHGKTDL